MQETVRVEKKCLVKKELWGRLKIKRKKDSVEKSSVVKEHQKTDLLRVGKRAKERE